MSATHYEHRQTAALMAVLFLFLAAALVSLPIVFGRDAVPGAIIGVVAMVLSLVFASLRTRVSGTSVEVAFGPGWPRRRFAIEDIESFEQVRNRWWYGWGMRAIPGGMMFSVWGLDAVELRYRRRTRTKKFRVGTDDPSGLLRALERARH